MPLLPCLGVVTRLPRRDLLHGRLGLVRIPPGRRLTEGNHGQQYETYESKPELTVSHPLPPSSVSRRYSTTERSEIWRAQKAA